MPSLPDRRAGRPLPGRNPAWLLAGNPFALGALLACLVAWAYWPVLRHDFILYDDADYVTNNDHVQGGLNGAGVRWAFTSTATANWHPLTWLSHELDCQLYGLRPWGHHLTSLLLHAANTVLLFLVLGRATGARWRSFLVAALFGLHPIHVQSVAWAAERKDVLSTLFFLLTLWAYCRHVNLSQVRSPRSKVYYLLALVLFALGLMCKQMLVTLPFVLLLLDYWPLGRNAKLGVRGAASGGKREGNPSWAKLVLEKIPFFILAAVASGVVFIVQKQAGAMPEHESFGFRLDNALVAYCRYLGKLFWPARLAIFYPFPAHPWPAETVCLAGLLLGALTILVLVLARRRAYLPTGWFWFVGTLVPVIGLVQVGTQAMADRYAYIPSIGIFVVVSWSIGEVMSGWRLRAVAGFVFLTATILAGVAATLQELGYWQNGETLFRRALAVTEPNSVSLTCLGEELAARRDFDEATRLFRQAMDLSPNFARARLELGYVLMEEGKFDEAVQTFQQAINLSPKFVKARVELGYALIEQGHLDQAMSRFREVVGIEPGNADAHNGLGVALFNSGRSDEAMVEYRAALEADPRHAEAHGNLAVALAQIGRRPEAIQEFQLAVKLRPGDAEIHDKLGTCLCQAGRTDEGIRQFQEALRLQPDYPGAQTHLAAALAEKAAQQAAGQ